MNLFTYYKSRLIDIIHELGAETLLPESLDTKNVTVESPRDAAHGDLATNVAMVLAKPAKMKPRDLADLLTKRLQQLDGVSGVDIAGPGFINMRLSNAFWQDRIKDVLNAGVRFGDSNLGKSQKVNIEYVSANPTGPMHVGHIRGAVFGDALANLLVKAGYDVAKEYYINDAGSQIDVLARSAYLRYREAFGETIGQIPEGLYPGDYLIPVGRSLKEKFGDQFLGQGEEVWLDPVRTFAAEAMLDLIRGDLKALGIEHEVFFSEKTLHTSGRIGEAIEVLRQRGHIYEGILEPPKGKKPEGWEEREQTLFRASDFGDDIDRPLMKSSGEYTYFAADIAYHFDKYKRGYKKMIDVLGADHGGYVKRIQAAIKALSDDGEMDARMCQLVRLFRGGEPVKMSKRAGTFVTLRDVVQEVGRDVTRFIMLTRRNDAPLDFDFEKVMEQSKDNPVFYVQYAHARICSVLRKAPDQFSEGLDTMDAALASSDVCLLTHSAEIGLIKKLSEWGRVVETAAQAHEPHRVAFYLYDLASEFHGLWNKGHDNPDLRFILENDRPLTLARLAMIRSTAIVLSSGLQVLGVEPVMEM